MPRGVGYPTFPACLDPPRSRATSRVEHGAPHAGVPRCGPRRRLCSATCSRSALARGPLGAGTAAPLYWGAWIGDQLTGTQPPWDMRAVSAVRSERRQGPLAGPLRLAVRRLLRARPAPSTRFPTGRWTASALRRDPPLQLELASTPAPAGAPARSSSGDVIAGTYDPYIRELRRSRPRLGPPVLPALRLGDERRLVPLGRGVNGNQPGEYVAAWRHVHDIFTAVGATNATWVWCPYADAKQRLRAAGPLLPRRRLRRLDLPRRLQLGQERRQPQPWRSFEEIFAPALPRRRQRSPRTSR